MPQALQSFTNSWRPFASRIVAAALAVLLAVLCLVEIGRIAAALKFQPAPIRTSAAAPIEPQQLARQVAAAHLFGRSGDTAAAAYRQRPPETSLQLTLRGAFAGGVATQGSAIIELQQGTTRSVRAGESIDRDIRLREVHPDHVVLERAGQLESLYFPQPGSLDPQAIPDPQSAAAQALMDGGPAIANDAAGMESDTSSLGADERREMIRQRLEELRQRAASNRTLP